MGHGQRIALSTDHGNHHHLPPCGMERSLYWGVYNSGTYHAGLPPMVCAQTHTKGVPPPWQIGTGSFVDCTSQLLLIQQNKYSHTLLGTPNKWTHCISRLSFLGHRM